MPRLCKNNWLETYLKYTEEQESPLAFHEWTAMTILSAALGRRVFIDRGYYTIYPNLFTILVAGSAKCKKSTALGIGINLLKSIDKPPMIFSQKITNEALIQALVEAREDDCSTGLVYASELSVFMGADATKSGLIPTLTDLYDSPSDWSYRTRGRGVEQMKNVTIAILAGSTKEWLRSSIPIEAVGGGFTSRIIFVFQDMPKKANLFPELSEHASECKRQLVADLNAIREINGRVIMSKAARDVASEWYEQELFCARDPKVEGYFARKHDTMFKVATILSVAERGDLIIEADHIKRALNMMSKNEVDLGNVMSSVTAAPVGGLMERVLDIIKREKRITHSDLLRKCWKFATAEDVSLYMKTLVESKEVIETLSSDNRTRIYQINLIR